MVHADPLTEVAKDFPSVTIGSYPRTEETEDYGVKIQLQSRDDQALKAAADAICERVKVRRQ